MKLQTSIAHPDFGTVKVRVFEDGESCIKQCNERIYLTKEQVIELHSLLGEVVEYFEQN